MEEDRQAPESYDFRQYDRLWQRVAPGLEPYPSPAPAAEGTEAGRRAGSGTAAGGGAPAPAAQSREMSRLPGAEENPCCMGTAAAELLQVLTGFAEEELEDQRQLQALARQAPSWARQRLRELAAEEGAHVRRLLAAHYIITGACYRPAVAVSRSAGGGWCERLRERYHAAACNGLNYARAAESTTDPCLRRLLEELSRAEYRQADALAALLERSLRL